MKTLIKIILIFIFISACSEDDNRLEPDIMDDPVAINVFCQSSPNDIMKRIEYEYENGNLITETTQYNGEIQSKKSIEYNSNNQIIIEIYETDWRKTEMTFIYNELDQLIRIEYKFSDYDSNGQLIGENESEGTFEYENNLLVREWVYWGGLTTYEYNEGKVIKKIDYTKNGGKHHITTYKYSGDLLIEEKKETKTGNLIYHKTFHYDSNNRLTIVKDGENIIEENFYSDNKLIEKREYYFGIDPCFAPCCGNYIYKYEY